MKVKICGLSKEEEVNFCVKHNVNFCGFILNYPKSHRFINFELAKKLTNIPKKNTKYVGVLVDPSKKELKRYSLLNIDYFQIYGDFTLKEINQIKKNFNKKIIMSLQIKKEDDILNYKLYESAADIILFDSTGLHQSLGWDYEWIKIVPKNVVKMIAGNINIDTLEKIKKIADIVDVSGALETNKVKDILKIDKFLKKINDKN